MPSTMQDQSDTFRVWRIIILLMCTKARVKNGHVMMRAITKVKCFKKDIKLRNFN